MDSFAWVVGAKSASWRSGVCDEIRPHPNSPILRIHTHFKFTHVEGRIAIRPYTCVIRTLANIHVITYKYKYTCKYLNTSKLMIKYIYIPT